ncbi:zinc finger matrin-type protein 3-like isoform X2 [Euwallacea fornicatus]|uniref:zinc finger matrin-type protein 3-like isoform X2 n=1 Tax=Euwallacea fornicatus TaxID=995702 RepID=UPI00338EC86E
MMSTEDGEFYPEKNLDKSYRIPRSDLHSNKANSNMAGRGGPFATQNETPLADSYYNYPYDPRAAGSYYQPNYQQFGNNRHASMLKGGFNFAAVPPPPPPPSSTIGAPLNKSIYDTLQQIKEKPKNYGRNIFHEIVPDLQDNTLPKDLKLLFQPLFCKLCSIQLSSNQTAKMHYKSKNHEKKIRKWLVEHAEKTGETLHPRAQSVGEKKAEDGEKDPRWYHCEVCDLQLTGQLHAESHYMGRNHQKALLGRRTPAGQGYYDKDGKWVRIKSVKQSSFNFEGGGDNFGMAFKTQKNDTTIGGPPTKKMKKEIDPQQFHCDVCNINTTCDEQLQNHYKGQKHAKKLKGMGIGAFGDQRKLVEKLVIPESGSTVVEVLNPSVVALPVVNPDDDLSVYRTPSGSFYCPSCNLTTNSKQQFVQHMNSKNHARKATQPTANGK